MNIFDCEQLHAQMKVWHQKNQGVPFYRMFGESEYAYACFVLKSMGGVWEQGWKDHNRITATRPRVRKGCLTSTRTRVKKKQKQMGK